MTVSQKLGEKMYADLQAKQAAETAAASETSQANSSASHGGGGAAAAAQSNDNVVDAEVKEVKRP